MLRRREHREVEGERARRERESERVPALLYSENSDRWRVALTSLTARRILPTGRIDHLVIYRLLRRSNLPVIVPATEGGTLNVRRNRPNYHARCACWLNRLDRDVPPSCWSCTKSSRGKCPPIYSQWRKTRSVIFSSVLYWNECAADETLRQGMKIFMGRLQVMRHAREYLTFRKMRERRVDTAKFFAESNERLLFSARHWKISPVRLTSSTQWKILLKPN